MPTDLQASFASAATASKNIAERATKNPAGASPGKDAQAGGRTGDPGGKATWWVFAAAVLVVAGGIAIWLSVGEKGSKAALGEPTLPLDTFVVNLDGGSQRAYLRVGITLGLSHPLARKSQEEVPIAALRDAILSVLASAKAEELLTNEGKEQLKGNLLRAITERVPRMGVANVYFTEFLVQM
jgi:flagellar basal body-associated protein FliL